MSLADLLSGRLGHRGRLPDRLEELRGPARGVIVLPRHLSWPGMREFDVTDDATRRSMYGIVLTQGQRNDVKRFLNADAAARGLAGAAGRRSTRGCGAGASAASRCPTASSPTPAASPGSLRPGR